MDVFLNSCNVDSLKKIASKLNIKNCSTSKASLIKEINNVFTPPPSPQIKKSMSPIGHPGRDGQTFEHNKRKTAIKVFHKVKSPVKILSEAEMQQMAFEKGVSPRVISYDPIARKIEMEKMDRTLYDVLKASNGRLLAKYQRRIINIFKILDELKIFHADPNVLNFMEKNGEIYIIDFGFAKKITKKLINKHGTDKLNMEFMPLGLYLKLKELCPSSEFKIIKEAIPETKRYIADL